jgi:hypothetical protein
MKIVLSSDNDDQIKIIFQQELYISIEHIHFLYHWSVKLPFKFNSFLGVWTRRSIEPLPPKDLRSTVAAEKTGRSR